MHLSLLKTKIHRATVTHSELNYEGSIAIDDNLLAATGVPGDVPADAAAATPATQAAQTPGGVLVMKASAQSWVQVKDANGRVVLQKTLAAGESVGAEGALPLSVIVGNASGTEVRVRGELLEVAKTTRDNVARFEVK